MIVAYDVDCMYDMYDMLGMYAAYGVCYMCCTCAMVCTVCVTCVVRALSTDAAIGGPKEERRFPAG